MLCPVTWGPLEDNFKNLGRSANTGSIPTSMVFLGDGSSVQGDLSDPDSVTLEMLDLARVKLILFK